MMEHTELFIISPEVCKAMDIETVQHICHDLRELGLYSLPYPKVTLRFNGNSVLTNSKHLGERGLPEEAYCDITITEVPGSGCCSVIVGNTINGFQQKLEGIKSSGMMDERGRTYTYTVNGNSDYDGLPPGEALRATTCDFLIAVLAIKNAVKVRHENKLAKLGIGKAKRKAGTGSYRFVTTITIPRPEEMEDDEDHPPTGKGRAPHLRRGHIRRQHYGPANAFIKQVWIAPVFVNADPGFVSTRKAYNVSTGATDVSKVEMA